MRSLLKRIRSASAVLLTVGLAACNTPSSSIYSPDTMTSLSTERQTHCMGRYLIDLPKDFQLATGGWGDIELYYGLDANFKRVYASVKSGLYTPDQFLKVARARHEELRTTINDETKGAMLLKSEKLGDMAVLFRRHDTVEGQGSIRSEVHQLVGQRYVVFEEKSYPPESMALSLAPDLFTHVNPGPVEERLGMISNRLLPYVNAASAPVGFCQQGVVFDVGQDDESATFEFFDPSRPDLHLEITYHAVTGQPKESLFERDPTLDARVTPLFVKSAGVQVRKGEITLGGMSAQELLYKLSKPIVQHIYKAETRTAKQSLRQPLISMTLSTGITYGRQSREQTSSSLSDAQVMELWDGAIRSVRPRSAAVARRSVRCRPGDVCPMSGMWAVDAAEHTSSEFKWWCERREPEVLRVRQGEVMPYVPRRSAQEQSDYEWKLLL